VSLAPGGHAEVDVVMQRGGALEGRVVDAHDDPVVGARVMVAAVRGSLERMTHTASDGSFAFAAMPAAVTLTAATGDDDAPDTRMSVAVPEGDRVEVTVKLPPAREPLGVTVVDERGRPVPVAEVTARSLVVASPLRTTAFTDDEGHTTLKRARGLPLRIEAAAPGRAATVVVTDGSSETVVIELGVGERVTGEVVAVRGREPVAGAEVALRSEATTRHARTGSDGAFVLTDVAPGSASLTVHAAGFAPAARTVDVPARGGRGDVSVDRVELEEEGVIDGDVTDAAGAAVVGARVALDHAPTWLLVGSTPPDVAVSDSRGHFVLRGLGEGTVTLEAYAADLGRASVSGVRVVAGRTTDRVRIAFAAGAHAPSETDTSGSVAVTLGESGSPPTVVVVSVVDGSEAERAGLKGGDVLLAVDDTPVATIEDARSRLSGPIGDDVVLRLQRASGTLTLRVGRDAVRR
jgi:hypothetical protein